MCTADFAKAIKNAKKESVSGWEWEKIAFYRLLGVFAAEVGADIQSAGVNKLINEIMEGKYENN